MEENDAIEPQVDGQGQEPTNASAMTEPHGTDWKAEARKWEERAKANRNAATRLDEVERAANEAKAELERMKAEKERADLLAKVSKEKGVPAELLHGDTEEELTSCADALAAFVESRAPGYPADKGGSNPGGTKLTRGSIEAVADPLERVRLIAQNRELFD